MISIPYFHIGQRFKSFVELQAFLKTYSKNTGLTLVISKSISLESKIKNDSLPLSIPLSFITKLKYYHIIIHVTTVYSEIPGRHLNKQKQ